MKDNYLEIWKFKNQEFIKRITKLVYVYGIEFYVKFRSKFIALLFPLSASPLLPVVFPRVSAAGTQAQNPF